jgi:hypothetical protein
LRVSVGGAIIDCTRRSNQLANQRLVLSQSKGFPASGSRCYRPGLSEALHQLDGAAHAYRKLRGGCSSRRPSLNCRNNPTTQIF